VLGRRGDRVAVDGKLEAGARVVVEGGYNVPNGTQLEEAPPKAAADEDDDDEDAKKDEKGDKDAKDAKDAKKPGGEPKQEHK
jgi:hypothetical protein